MVSVDAERWKIHRISWDSAAVVLLLDWRLRDFDCRIVSYGRSCWGTGENNWSFRDRRSTAPARDA